MIRTWTLPLLMVALAALPASAVVTFEWAHVGNAGNAPDPQTGFGAVPYNYAISKTEVTNAQYVEFLNAADPTGANVRTLYNGSMLGSNLGGINFNGRAPNGSKYEIKSGRDNNPVVYVSFIDAIRFTNWLHNGQGKGSTETGAYRISNGLFEIRSTGAKFWLPSENEWYKAAYHDATAGTAGIYFDYATGSNDIPVSDRPGDNPAAVNYYNNDGVANGFNDGYAVSGLPSFVSGTNPYTDVGAYTAAASPYGTFDQNGNVMEWNEAYVSPSFRSLRGGSWVNDSFAGDLRAVFRDFSYPTHEDVVIGFRVATVPEPSTLLMGALAACVILMRVRV